MCGIMGLGCLSDRPRIDPACEMEVRFCLIRVMGLVTSPGAGWRHGPYVSTSILGEHAPCILLYYNSRTVIARRAVALSEAESLKATVVADTIARLGLAQSAHVPLASASTRTRRRPGLLCDGCGVTTAPVLFRVQANQGAAARQLLVAVAGRLCRKTDALVGVGRTWPACAQGSRDMCGTRAQRCARSARSR